ncbi:uncharacterized protein [Misgurnus anguillicaudatus]|uniref:uncharacterized protein n=1 Tax=Misgurnus anguillicaudatus TaxID=75329 RepID=UPI003CCFCB91
MGKCKFADSWLENDEFKPWLKPVAENNREAYCTYCKKKISVASMGINAIKSHMHGASHKAAFGHREQSQLSIASFCAPTATPLPNTTAELVKTATTATSPPSSADIRVAMGSTSTMRAEVIWCLNTAANHHSLNSNEGISDIFKSMFPDSDIAKTFTCGKDKTGYIMRFGLAPFFKQQLVDTINKAGSFVFMFDESLNQSTKKKQLDVHVRFWDDDCVQSRYLGSQFLGHGTAQDLLHHIKECVAKLNMMQLISISMDGSGLTCSCTQHSATTVERGFSVNKQVETCNILEESMEALRLICDKISACGGALKVPLTKELLASVASARSKYRIHLEQERKKKETTRQSLKRKEAEDELEVLKKKRKVLREVCDTLQKDADQLAEQAEGKSGSLMAQLITKSNTLRRRHKEKLIDLEQTQKFIESKSDELRHMSGV